MFVLLMRIFRWRTLGGNPVTSLSNLKRMAKLRATGMSFGSALTLGLGLGHVAASNGRVRYNGAGFKGDREAVGQDFRQAIGKAASRAVPRG